jgi:type 1 glutamine amidotransferase
LNAAYPNVHAVVYSTNNWPKKLTHADAIAVSLNHGQRAATDSEIAAAVRRGAGFMAMHFGVEVNKGEAGDNYLRWMGGYFETEWSVNPWWQPDFKEIPEHPTTRGVNPFSVRDEWYYHMRFVNDMDDVTPILSAIPPISTVSEKTSERGGNPAAFKDVSDGKIQHMAWAYQRQDKGRGFGFTGLHLHENLGNDNFRKILLNGVAWIANLEIPQSGVAGDNVNKEQLEKLIDEAQAALKAGK